MRSFDQIENMLSGGPPQSPASSTSDVLLFETLWYDPADGWAIFSRQHARALLDRGHNLRMQSWAPLLRGSHDPYELGRMSREELERVVVPEGQLHAMIDPAVLAEIGGPGNIYKRGDPFGFYLFSTALGGPMLVEGPLNMLCNYPRPRALLTMFERTRVVPETAEQLRELDGVAVLCTKNADELHRHGVKAAVIPPCYRDDDPIMKVRRYKSRNVHAPTKFYWIGRNEPRKAMDNVIRAYLRAFGAGAVFATLTLKMSPIKWSGDVLSPEDVVEQELGHRDLVRAGITVVEGRLTRAEMAALHASHHVYVSASRGEGWDLPAFEAKLVGNRVVSTDCGGARDFLQPEDGDVLIGATGEVPAHERYWWGPGAAYIDYDLKDVSGAMALVHEEEQPPFSMEHLEQFSQPVVGRKLDNWIEEIWK